MKIIAIEDNVLQLLHSKLDDIITRMSNTNDNVNSPEWMNTKDVLRFLGISSRTLQNYRDKGMISFSQIGRKKLLYKKSDVQQFLDDNYNKQFNHERNKR